MDVWLRMADWESKRPALQQELGGTTSTTECASSCSMRKNTQTRDP